MAGSTSKIRIWSRVRFRYSLRTLLGLVTLAALPAAWVGAKRTQVLTQCGAVAQLEARETKIEYSTEFVLPEWLRRLLHDDTRCVASVNFAERGSNCSSLRESFDWLLADRAKLVGFLASNGGRYDAAFQDCLRDCETALHNVVLKPNPNAFGYGDWRPGEVKTADSDVRLLLEEIDRSLLAIKVRLEEIKLRDEDFAALSRLAGLQQLCLGGTDVRNEQLACLEEMPELGSLSLRRTSIDDAGLVHLRRLSKLEYLDLSQTRVTDAGFADLRKLGALRNWHADETLVGDRCLAWLGNCADLEHLDVQGSQITDRGLRHIAGLKKLKSLFLSRTKVGDAGMRQLTSLAALEDLYLDGTQVGDAGLEPIGQLTSLTDLSLNDTAVSDAGMHWLGDLHALRHVKLAQAGVTDRGLARLKSLTKLEVLDVSEGLITPAGVGDPFLMPRCRVYGLLDIVGQNVPHLLPQKAYRFWGGQPQSSDDSGTRVLAVHWSPDGRSCRFCLGNKAGEKLFLLWKQGVADFYVSEVFVLPSLDAELQGRRQQVVFHTEASYLVGDTLEAALRTHGIDPPTATPALVAAKSAEAGWGNGLVTLWLACRQLRCGNPHVAVTAAAAGEYLDRFNNVRTSGDKQRRITAIESHIFIRFNNDCCEAMFGFRSLGRANDTFLGLVASLSEVRSLKWPSWNDFSDAGLTRLAEAQQLEVLDLGELGDWVTDAGVAQLWKLPRLRSLAIRSRRLGDSALAGISQLSQLKELDIQFAEIGEPSLAEIARLKQLESLTFFADTISVPGLRRLEDLKHLRRLYLNIQKPPADLRAAKAAVARLHAALPNADVGDTFGALKGP